MKQIALTSIENTTTMPGKNPGAFVIKFDEDFGLCKNDILVGANGYKVRITKVYKYNLWRRILHFFGLKFKLFNCVLVKEIE